MWRRKPKTTEMDPLLKFLEYDEEMTDEHFEELMIGLTGQIEVLTRGADTCWFSDDDGNTVAYNFFGFNIFGESRPGLPEREIWQKKLV